MSAQQKFIFAKRYEYFIDFESKRLLVVVRIFPLTLRSKNLFIATQPLKEILTEKRPMTQK